MNTPNNEPNLLRLIRAHDHHLGRLALYSALGLNNLTQIATYYLQDIEFQAAELNFYFIPQEK